jgi:hypothetical protein
VNQDGQATIEAALTLPIVLIALLMIVQVGVVVRDALSLTHAAREGARAAVVTDDDAAIHQAVIGAAGSLDADGIDIAIDPSQAGRRRGESVRIDLAYELRLSIPIVSRIFTATLPLRATSTMRMERTTATPVPSGSPP